MHFLPFFSSVQFSCWVVSDFLQPHGLQHVSLPCPSPSPGACSNWDGWMPSTHLILRHLLLLLPSIFPSIKIFSNESALPIRWPNYWSFSFSVTSVLPMNIQDWYPLGLTGWISLQSKGLSRVFSNTAFQKHQFFSSQFSLWPKSHIHTWPLEKPQLWLDRPLSASNVSAF